MVIESFLLSGVRGNSILSELNHFFYSFFAFGLTSIVTLQMKLLELNMCMFVNDVRPKRRKNNQVQRIVKRPAGVEREGRSEAEERPNEAHRAARRGEIIAR